MVIECYDLNEEEAKNIMHTVLVNKECSASGIYTEAVKTDDIMKGYFRFSKYYKIRDLLTLRGVELRKYIENLSVLRTSTSELYNMVLEAYGKHIHGIIYIVRLLYQNYFNCAICATDYDLSGVENELCDKFAKRLFKNF